VSDQYGGRGGGWHTPWGSGVRAPGLRSGPARGRVLTAASRSQLPEKYFGEGITVLGDKLYQLTWRSNRCRAAPPPLCRTSLCPPVACPSDGIGCFGRRGFIYDKESLKLLGDFSYAHEGWGFTTDGKQLIVSDGTAVLHFWDPETLAETRQLTVRYLGKRTGELMKLSRLNDLQWWKGRILANIWELDRLAVINPESGIVERFIELKGCSPPPPSIWTRLVPPPVLNGHVSSACWTRRTSTSGSSPSPTAA
jgi:glutamine cyclotransferase